MNLEELMASTPPMQQHALIKGFQAGAASRDAEVAALQAEIERKMSAGGFVLKENDQLRNQVTLLRDALTKERDQLCEDVTMLREALRDCAYDEGGFCINPDAAEALAATEPKP